MFKLIKQRLLAYIQTLRPMLSELMRFKAGLLSAIMPGFMAVASELGAITLIYLSFAPSRAASGKVMRQVSNMVAGWGFTFPVILLAFSAAMYFASSLLSVRFANLFAEHSVTRLHEGLRDIRAWPAFGVTREFSTLQKLNRVQRNALIVNARVVRILISLLVPLLLFLGSYILLFSINFRIGMAISCVLFILAGIQATIGLKSARSNSRWESLSPQAFSDLRKELGQRLYEPGDAYSKGRLLRIVKRILSIQKDRILVTAYSQIAISTGLVGTLAAMLFYFHSQESLILEKDMPATVVVVMIVIRLFMSLRGLGGQVTVINRFYPQISRYFRLIKILDNGLYPANPERSEVRSTTIMTDLPDNQLNRLRWKSILFSGREVDFDGTGNGLRVHISSPEEVDKEQDKHMWVDFEEMKNGPPILCPAADVDLVMKRFKVNKRKESRESEPDGEDDME